MDTPVDLVIELENTLIVLDDDTPPKKNKPNIPWSNVDLLLIFVINLLHDKPHCPAPKKKGDGWTNFAEEVIGKIPLFLNFNEVDGENLKKFLQLMRCSKETPGCFKKAWDSHHFCQAVGELELTLADHEKELANKKKRDTSYQEREIKNRQCIL